MHKHKHTSRQFTESRLFTNKLQGQCEELHGKLADKDVEVIGNGKDDIKFACGRIGDGDWTYYPSPPASHVGVRTKSLVSANVL